MVRMLRRKGQRSFMLMTTRCLKIHIGKHIFPMMWSGTMALEFYRALEHNEKESWTLVTLKLWGTVYERDVI